MTPEQIVINNRIIAEFHGFIPDGMSRKTLFGKKYPLFKDYMTGIRVYDNFFEYHKDWNWIILVVRQIQVTGFNVDILSLHRCHIYRNDHGLELGVGDPNIEIRTSQVTSKIESVYVAILEFIKWKSTQSK